MDSGEGHRELRPKGAGVSLAFSVGGPAGLAGTVIGLGDSLLMTVGVPGAIPSGSVIVRAATD